MPEFLRPLRGRCTFAMAIRWYRCAQPPATIWQAFGLRRRRDEGELSQQWRLRYHLGLPGSYQDPRTTILSCPSYAKWKGVADLYACGYNRGGVAVYQSPYYGTGRHSQFGLFDNKNAEVRRLWNSDKQAHLEFPDPL